MVVLIFLGFDVFVGGSLLFLMATQNLGLEGSGNKWSLFLDIDSSEVDVIIFKLGSVLSDNMTGCCVIGAYGRVAWILLSYLGCDVFRDGRGWRA